MKTFEKGSINQRVSAIGFPLFRNKISILEMEWCGNLSRIVELWDNSGSNGYLNVFGLRDIIQNFSGLRNINRKISSFKLCNQEIFSVYIKHKISCVYFVTRNFFLKFIFTKFESQFINIQDYSAVVFLFTSTFQGGA